MRSIAAFAAALALACPLAAPAASAAAPPASTNAAADSPVRSWQRLAGIDPTGWRLLAETPYILTWIRPDGIQVSLDVMSRAPDHDPWMYDQAKAQDYFREEWVRHHTGLVEVEVRHMPHGTYDLVTTKARLGEISPANAGSVANVYTMIAAFPMPTAVGEIRLMAVEGQPTGLREALVSITRTIKENDGKPVAMPMHDPYDARFDATARYMDSDARQWDVAAPDHPLTRIRRLMPQLLATSGLLGVPETVAPELAAASAAANEKAASNAAGR